MSREIKMKFFAFTLHLEGMDETQRAARSPEHADSMVAMISSAALNKVEKDDVLNSIMIAPNRNVWVASDLSRVVAAVEAMCAKRRRETQNYADNLLSYMLPSEWATWKENAAQGCDNTATELIQRIKSVGGKNLCEFSKKRAASIWLFLRGDARSLGHAARAVFREQFTQKLGKHVRDFEPLEYIVKLPEPSVFERDHNEMWLRAFSVETPSAIATADFNEVLFIDGLFQGVRGGIHSRHAFEPTLQMQPTMSPMQMQPTMNPMDIMRFAMQHFQMMCQNPANGPNLTIYGGQPRGKPMRSLQNAARPSSLPPLLSDGHSEGAHLPVLDDIRAEDAGAGAGSALAGDADSTPMTPPQLRSPADTPAASQRSAPPSPKLATSDGRDAVELTLQRMLARSKRPAAAATEPAHTASKKPKKTEPPKKSCKTPVKKTPAKKEKDGVALTTPTKPDRKKPTISWETSRNQVMCRSGLSGPGSTHRITFKEAGGAKKAYALAQAWLEKANKEYEKAHK